MNLILPSKHNGASRRNKLPHIQGKLRLTDPHGWRVPDPQSVPVSNPSPHQGFTQRAGCGADLMPRVGISCRRQLGALLEGPNAFAPHLTKEAASQAFPRRPPQGPLFAEQLQPEFTATK